MWKNTWLKELAGKYGLEKGKSIIVEERSGIISPPFLLSDGKWQKGILPL